MTNAKSMSSGFDGKLYVHPKNVQQHPRSCGCGRTAPWFPENEELHLEKLQAAAFSLAKNPQNVPLLDDHKEKKESPKVLLY